MPSPGRREIRLGRLTSFMPNAMAAGEFRDPPRESWRVGLG